MEDSAGGGSGSMAINLPLHSHLGPINCCPCRLLGRLYCQYRRCTVAAAWDVFTRSRQQDRHSKTKDVLIENNWLARIVCVCVFVCTLMHMIQLPGDAASSHPSFLPSYHLSSEYPEVSQCSTEITVDVYLQQFKTFNFSERALRGAMVFSATRL